MNKIGREATDIYLFSRLPNSDQKAILNQATPEERKRYFPKAHQAVRAEFYRDDLCTSGKGMSACKRSMALLSSCSIAPGVVLAIAVRWH
jgi:hypothetical protein